MIPSPDQYERMFLLPGTLALVIDTDQPVTDHFADNLCAFCTGLHTKLGAALWRDRFFAEMSIDPKAEPKFNGKKGDWPNPYCKWARHGWQDKKFWTPVSPWPTPGWMHNGLYNYANTQTRRTLNGLEVGEAELFEQYTYPAHMSVALFFSKRLHELLENIIRGRAARFCSEYPNSTSGKFYTITGVRWQDIPA